MLCRRILAISRRTLSNGPAEVSNEAPRGYDQETDGAQIQEMLQSLKSTGRLTNAKPFVVPENLESTIESVVKGVDSNVSDWRNMSLVDRKMKFKVNESLSYILVIYYSFQGSQCHFSRNWLLVPELPSYQNEFSIGRFGSLQTTVVLGQRKSCVA